MSILVLLVVRSIRRLLLLSAWLAPLAVPVAATQHPLPQHHATPPAKPNILVILTDDQDLHMDSLSYMPNLQKHLIDEGLFFRHHYCTVALCCPSRASIWTGKAAHNTNITDVNPPHGGYPKFVSQGFNDNYLPLWLQDLGYTTYYTGKLFNAHSVVNYNKPFPRGWNESDFLLDPYTYEYLNATFQQNTDPPVSHEGSYSTDVLINKSLAFLTAAVSQRPDHPFFLTIAPTAPHSNVHIHSALINSTFTNKSVTQSPPIPAARHAHLFENITVPRTPHFNPSQPQRGSASWISNLPLQNGTNIAFNDHFYRSRLRALQPVDELIDSIIAKLEAAGQLENTYIIYTTDNGYHIGQHRLQPGKQCAFEEDVSVPFIVRGPGVPRGVSTGGGVVTNHVDIAPTILRLAGWEAGAGEERVGMVEKFGLDGAVMP
ncbi:Arylsulfatase [Cyphellophora attinorum]|uniref:Arylsulfatase n=1 Tax=Cyphellophora attinorum TaxID=1664694 RepID=A0A0N0NJR0_9EURO|nr:Arylsulfatase [Phialophora attinorum]KPI36939.1 Arylsulfatase [Phialophora attinorum]